MQHHCHGIAQVVQAVVPDVHSADADGTFRHVVKSGNELYEGAFCRPRAADYAHDFAGRDVQIDVFEVEHVGVFGIGKIHSVEIYAAVGDFVRRGRGIVSYVGHFPEHFDYTPRRRARKHEHHEHHRHHGKRHQYLHNVIEECGQRTVVHIPRDYLIAAEPHHGDDASERDQLHKRHCYDKHLLGRELKFLHQRAYLFELVRFEVLSHEGLDRAYCGEVFLRDFVHIVVLFQHFHKTRIDDYDGQRDGENDGEPRIDGDSHTQRQNEHNGRTHQHAYDHHIGHLHVGDVGGEARHEPRGAETVEVGKAEILHLIVNAAAHVHTEPRRRIRRKPARQRAEHQRQQRHHYHQRAAYHDEFRARRDGEQRRFGGAELQNEGVGSQPLFKSDVDYLRHNEGDEHFQHHLENDEYRSQHGSGLVLSHTTEQRAEHALFLFGFFLFHNISPGFDGYAEKTTGVACNVILYVECSIKSTPARVNAAYKCAMSPKRQISRRKTKLSEKNAG